MIDHNRDFSCRHNLGLRAAARGARPPATVIAGLVAALAFPPSLATAGALQEARPYASLSFNHDTNPWRLADTEAGVIPGTESSRADDFSRIEAGFDADIESGRQLFAFDGHLYRDAYDTFSAIDHRGAGAEARWAWNQGNPWTGDLGYVFSKRLRSFANQASPIVDLRRENRRFASVGRAIGDGFRLEASASDSDLAYAQSAGLSLDRQTGALTLRYLTAADNSIDVKAERLETRFKRATLNDYDEDRILATVGLALSARTQLTIEGGHVHRTHANLRRPDFSGVVGRIVARLDTGSRRRIEASLFRDVSTLSDEVANYAVIQGVSFEPRWALSRRTALRLNAHYEDRDFRGDRTGIAPGNPLEDRNDEVVTVGFAIDWEVLRNLSLSFSHERQDRSSNLPTEEYDYGMTSIEVRFAVD